MRCGAVCDRLEVSSFGGLETSFGMTLNDLVTPVLWGPAASRIRIIWEAHDVMNRRLQLLC